MSARRPSRQGPEWERAQPDRPRPHAKMLKRMRDSPPRPAPGAGRHKRIRPRAAQTVMLRAQECEGKRSVYKKTYAFHGCGRVRQ